MRHFLSIVIVLCPLLVTGQLAVTVLPVKVMGHKAVVKLVMKNSLANKIESARAVCFLMDGQGKVVSQATKWVVGKSGLEPKGQAIFNFVLSSRQPFVTTNLFTKITFNRVNLDNGSVADVQHEVVVSAAIK